MAFDVIAIGHGIVRVARGARKQDFADLYRRIRSLVFGYLRQGSAQFLRGEILRPMWGFSALWWVLCSQATGYLFGRFLVHLPK